MNRKYEITWSDKAIFPYDYSKAHSFKVDAQNLNKAWIKFLMHNQLDENVHTVHIWVEPMSSYKIRKEKKNEA